MRTVGKFLLVGAILAALLVSIAPKGAVAKEPDKLLFGLNWVWYGVHGYFVPALKLGYYKDVNLDVDIKRGYGSGDAVKRAHLGTADVVLADSNSLIVARSRGVTVKTIGVLENLAPHSVIARRDHGINELKDLEGKSFAGPKTGANIIMLPTLCELAGVDFSKIKVVTVNAQSKDPMLFTGKVDAIGQFQGGGGTKYKRIAREKNIDLIWFPFHRYGFKSYGLSLMASEKMIAEKPDVLKRFLSATFKGVAWALDHPEDTLKMFTEFHPEINQLYMKEGFDDARNLILPQMHPNGLGWFKKDRVKFAVDAVVKAQNLQPVAVEDVYTNELLSKIKPKSTK
jgi:NitT/TauT family transport system substrate-binding protein